ncbi:MAG: iron-sulfur cluster assembly protein [Opitutales bacterium]
MSEENSISLNRACDAMLIPAGVKVRIAKDTQLSITHRLGGNFTVTGAFGMARISMKDADALGEEIPSEFKPDSADNAESQARTLPSKEDIWEIAKTVYDPEVPVNIVDLGLVYRVDIFTDALNLNNVEIDMTLTSPGCVMGPMIAEDLKGRILALPNIDLVEVLIVWDPPWSKEMISEEAKMILGLV